MTGRLFSIFFITLICFMPFNGNLPVTDPVESNYALTAKEMVVGGDWISPQIYGQYWFDKPIMIYWLIAASFKIFGIGEFAARFPAGVFGAASVTLVYWFSWRVYANPRTAFFAALALGSGLEFWVLSKMIITDVVLLFWVSGVMVAMFLSLQNPRWQILAGFFAGLAVLTKGPVGVVLPSLTMVVFALCRRDLAVLRRLLHWPGIVAFLLAAVPWYGVMYLVHGIDFVKTFLGLHNILRATVSEHPKDNVFYYYLVLFPVSLLPWTGVFFRGIGFLIRDYRSALASYLLCWIGVILIFYSLMATKYPTYVFTAAFPAAIITGWMLEKMTRESGRRQWLWLSLPVWLLLGIWGAGIWALPAARLPELVGIAAAGVSGVLLWMQVKGNHRLLPLFTGAGVFFVSILVIYSGFIPLTEERSGKKMVQFLPRTGAVVGSVGDYSTSFVFYSGYRVPRLIENTPASEAQTPWSGKYTMPTATWDSFIDNAKQKDEVYLLRKERDAAEKTLQYQWRLLHRQGSMELWRWKQWE